MDMTTMGAQRAQNSLHETSTEKAFREAARFPECENSMSFPLLSKRGFSAAGILGAVVDRVPFGKTISGIVGRFIPGPFIKKVDPRKHEVWLLDNTAYQTSPNGPWQATFTAAYFDYDSGEDISEVVSEVAKSIGIVPDERTRDRMATRLEPFFTTILERHFATITLCGQTNKKLSPSDNNGIGHDTIVIPGQWRDGQTCESLVRNVSHSTPCSTTFADTDGWAVISDIDDTIKITGTGDPIEAARNTFAEESKPVPGMPEVFQFLEKRLDNPPFWYVSASPYVLYPFLREFRTKYFPSGPMQLRETTLTNLAGIFTSLTVGVQDYKVGAFEKLYKNFPNRKMICIGDSTQSDPEAYAEIYKRHPGWIKGIFIRNVFGKAGGAFEVTGKNAPERFEKAFESVPKEDWYVFEDANELPDRIDALMRRNGA